MSVFARHDRGALVVLTLTMLAIIAPLSLSAATVQVVQNGNSPCISNLPAYSSIQTAVNSVPAGSTIKICPGTYAEQIMITKAMSLIGVAGNGLTYGAASGANNPVIVSPALGVMVNAYDLYNAQPTAAQIAVLSPGDKVYINNLTIDGSNNGLNSCATDLVGIYYQNASGTVNHVVTRFQELAPADFGCQDGLAIYVQSGYATTGTANVTIENSSVHDYDKNGITADGIGTVATITGNYVVGIGATPATAQNGIQLSDGASGKITNNTVTDDVYVNPPNCSTPSNPPCYSATGILLYDSGGTSGTHVPVSGNTVSNTQGAIIIFTDSAQTADWNDVTSNKITTSPSAGIYLLDGIDLCSNNNTAKSNTVFNSSGAGVHNDSQCVENGGATGNNNVIANNTINEACAGVLTGHGASPAPTGTTTFNVVQTVASGDICPAGTSKRTTPRLRPQPRRQ